MTVSQLRTALQLLHPDGIVKMEFAGAKYDISQTLEYETQYQASLLMGHPSQVTLKIEGLREKDEKSCSSLSL